MCGISGIVGRSQQSAVRRVTAMLASMVARGPDGHGIHHEPGVTVGIRRLSIIDLAGGDQPLHSPDGSLTLVANAEIYNYVELRRTLQAKGHQFRTKSDCEVIIHAYEEYGADCLTRLRGMFAFALVDTVRRTLLLARDRMGEKPLYLYRDDGILAFASSVRALLRSGLAPVRIDYRALHDYFHYQYVPEPRTLVESVWQLPAGHLLIADTTNGRFTERAYWQFETPGRGEETPGWSEKTPGRSAETPGRSEPAGGLGRELERIGPLVVRSDVPIGVALSGGIDSSVVAALVASNSSGAAFSLGYAGRPAVDERTAAHRVATELGLDFHHVELSGSDVAGTFDEMVTALDHPIADMASFGYFALARLASAHGVKVLLHGHGGDELFWGYRWVRGALSAVDHRPDRPLDRRQLYAHSEAFKLTARLLPRLCTRSFAALSPGEQIAAEPDPPPVSLRVMRLLTDTYLRSNGIAQTERLSMATGVEVRLPLLDHRFVELVVAAQQARDDSADPPKTRLRQAVTGLLPAFAVRRPKRPFATPTRQWHRSLFAAYHERVDDGWLAANGVLTRDGARRLALGTCGIGNGTSLSFKALVFETWLRSLPGQPT